jgi:hypothetical protein
MNLEALQSVLTQRKSTFVGIPVIPPSLLTDCLEFLRWSLEGRPEEGRQVWFVFPEPKLFQDQLPSTVRGRILPLSVEQGNFCLYSVPSDALLVANEYGDPNKSLSPFWQERGCYEQESTEISSDCTVWIWKSKFAPLRLYGIDHHHAVLWDIKQTLRPLGITVDFVWLCDGRPSVNEAIPGQDGPFRSSLDVYRPPVTVSLDPVFQERIQSTYDAVITSHSLVTAYRLREIQLPQFHINSTRFGNSWVTDSQRHPVLVEAIQEMLRKKKLQVIHNNQGDSLYFHQFFTPDPSSECILPSLCDSMLRHRFQPVTPMKFLIWDTRQVLFQDNKSPFMKALYRACFEKAPDAFHSQAILLAELKTFLPEGYLDAYTAVIHIPYNVSTMSIFQQVAANIPVWVPSKRLLQELWLNPKECNELSWTVFSEGSQANTSFLDQARNPEAVKCWIDTADFYDNRISECIFTFDSIEELLERIFTVDYQFAMKKNQEAFLKRQENVIATWEMLLKPLRESQKN